MLIAAAVFAALVVGGMIYYRYRAVSNLKLPTLPEVKQSLTGNTIEGRLTTVEDALAILVDRVNGLSGTTSTTTSPAPVSADAQSRIQSLENTVANLQVQINQLKGSETPQVTEVSLKPPSFIPLGTGGSVNSRDWVSVDGYQVTIDSADYSGSSGAYLEVNMRLSEPKATRAFARLYNTTNNSAASLEASTTATTFSLAVTSSFQLSPGKKTYNLQMKSTDTGEIFVQDARIKVNF